MTQIQPPRVPSGPSSTERTPATTVAGLCYLAVIAGGLFAQGVVRQPLMVAGDPAATTLGILENEMLWRFGLATHLLYLVPALTMKVIVAGLFRSLDPTMARLALVFGVAAVAIEAMALVFLYVPLAVIETGGATLAPLQDASSLIYLGTQLHAAGFAFSLLLFAAFCVMVGVLILRTPLVPRVIGAMMIVAGICYVVNTVAMIVTPDFFASINPAILLPIVVAELTLALWLLMKGVVVARRVET